MDNRKPIDPDVWTALALLVSTVSMVAQLAGLKTGATAKGLKDSNTSFGYEKLRDELESAVRNAEKLIRILGHASGVGPEPLSAPFRFGEARILLPMSEFQRYRELVQQIALNAGNLSSWALQLIQIDPGFAEEIGNRIVVEVGGVQQRINDLFTKSHTNEEVLDECLLLLGSFNQLLGRFEQHRN